MPVTVKKVGGAYRVVEKATGKIVTRGGKPVDGGGHLTAQGAQEQASAINISQARKRGHHIPKKK